jgi:hypothetical protein
MARFNIFTPRFERIDLRHLIISQSLNLQFWCLLLMLPSESSDRLPGGDL